MEHHSTQYMFDVVDYETRSLSTECNEFMPQPTPPPRPRGGGGGNSDCYVFGVLCPMLLGSKGIDADL